jgi:hypothetical protein
LAAKVCSFYEAPPATPPLADVEYVTKPFAVVNVQAGGTTGVNWSGNLNSKARLRYIDNLSQHRKLETVTNAQH